MFHSSRICRTLWKCSINTSCATKRAAKEGVQNLEENICCFKCSNICSEIPLRFIPTPSRVGSWENHAVVCCVVLLFAAFWVVFARFWRSRLWRWHLSFRPEFAAFWRWHPSFGMVRPPLISIFAWCFATCYNLFVWECSTWWQELKLTGRNEILFCRCCSFCWWWLGGCCW